LAVAVLGLILSRRGIRTVVAGNVGPPCVEPAESTIPYITTLLKWLGDRYALPELRDLAHFETVQARVTPPCAPNRHLTLLSPPGRSGWVEPLRFEFPAEHSEYQVRAGDLVAFLLSRAVRVGAEVRDAVTDGTVSPLPDYPSGSLPADVAI